MQKKHFAFNQKPQAIRHTRSFLSTESDKNHFKKKNQKSVLTKVK